MTGLILKRSFWQQNGEEMGGQGTRLEAERSDGKRQQGEKVMGTEKCVGGQIGGAYTGPV